MADDPNLRTQADRTRINTSQEHEVRYWTEALGCTEEQLKAAVSAVGNSAEKVREHIKSRTH